MVQARRNLRVLIKFPEPKILIRVISKCLMCDESPMRIKLLVFQKPLKS